MKKLIILCMASIFLLTACKQKPQGVTSSQPSVENSQSQSQADSTPNNGDVKIPSSVPHTKTGIEGEDEKYPVEKLEVKLESLTNEAITKYAGTAFSYIPLPALPESEGGGIRLYQMKFENGEMFWQYGKVESEFIYSYKGYYTLVQDGVIEATLTNMSDPNDNIDISFHIKMPTKQDDKDIVLQARMLYCTNSFFDDMSDLLLVYHDKIVVD